MIAGEMQVSLLVKKAVQETVKGVRDQQAYLGPFGEGNWKVNEMVTEIKMRLKDSDQIASGQPKKPSVSAADLLKSVMEGVAPKVNSNVASRSDSNLTSRGDETSNPYNGKASEMISESSHLMDKDATTKKNMDAENSHPSSNPDRPFDEPRSRKERRTSSQPYLIPESGCRRKRNRRSRRSKMRGGSWWMQRTYANRENR